MKARLALAVALTIAAGQFGLVRAADRDATEAAVTVAINHLRDELPDGVEAADLDALRVTSAIGSRHNGVQHVYLRQTLDGLDVLTGDVTVSVRDGKVLHVGSRLLDGVAERASGELTLNALEAVRAAAAHVNLVPDATLRVVDRLGTAERVTQFSSGGISSGEIPARLVYAPSDDTLRLGWEIDIDTGHNWWNLIVDAEDGSLLAQNDYVVHESAEHIAHATAHADGEAAELAPPMPAASQPFAGVDDGSAYRVYAWPLESPNDGDRTLVTNPAHPGASPYGWHDTDGVPGPEYTTTQGNNVHAIWDPGANREVLPTQSTASPLTFDHELDLSMPPTLWRDAAVTNLFYWNNVIHDVFHGYGFDEVSGNFQEKNYTEQGLGMDSVRADAQDTGPGVGLGVPPVSPPIDNANFATPQEGQRPRMQMYLWAATGKRQLRDGDLDAGIVIHEYGHGISIRLTGGAFNVRCLDNDEQAGEGWSDFLAIASTVRSEAEGSLKRGLATYANGDDSRTGSGIRPTAYHRFNPRPNYDTIKSESVPHGVGYVWAAMLWNLYWELVDAHGFNPNVYDAWNTGGNNRAIQLVIDGMKMQPCSPGFVDSRDAILAADLALTDGEDRCRIWKAFAFRGLGVGANQGSNQSAIDGTMSFAMPEDCT